MDLQEKIRTLPTRPGVYLYKNADGDVIYVGKAKNLRSRVRSYLLEASQANAKTGSLMREAVDVDYIMVDNEHEALALENNLIKQRKPRFNILLRDDKTYPYIKLTLADRYPKVLVTRRLRRDGSAYYGPWFPGNLAWRLADLIHRAFLLPSCKVDLNRDHPRPCLQYYIHRCLGPCVRNLTTPETYAEAVRDAQLFLEGRTSDLNRSLHQRMAQAAEAQQFELAAKYRDLLVTIDQMSEKQRIASTENDDADVFGFHLENGMIAVNLFHIRAGKIVDRREFFWEDISDFITDPDPDPNEAVIQSEAEPIAEAVILSEGRNADEVEGPAFPPGAAHSATEADPIPAASFTPATLFSALLKQLYIDQPYVPTALYLPVDFPDRATLAALLAQQSGHRVEIAIPQRGDKRSLIDLAGQNAKQSYDQRFRVLQPSRKALQTALQDALMLEEPPRRIECFDISHIQGAETVASMVVWENGQMNKSAYRKFRIKTVSGVDDFASMREVIGRRYRAFGNHDSADPTTSVQEENKAVILSEGRNAAEVEGPAFSSLGSDEYASSQPASTEKPQMDRRSDSPNAELPSLILIDGGLGQLHAAAAALEELGITTQPLAAIAKREEIIYLYGQEDDPIVLDRRSPVLHLIQQIRDESHRFAITYHRKRREMRDRDSELLAIPGVGARTRQRLLEHFGSLRSISTATLEALSAVVPPKTAEAIHHHFH